MNLHSCAAQNPPDTRVRSNREHRILVVSIADENNGTGPSTRDGNARPEAVRDDAAAAQAVKSCP